MAPRPASSFLLTLVACVVVAFGGLVGAAGAQAPGPVDPAATPSPAPEVTPTPAPVPSPTPAAPVAPGATTGVAEAVAQTTASLTATVDPGGADTTYSFELGTTSNYGVSTASQTVAAGAGPVAVRITATGLTSSTTYHYRVIATNAAGISRGADRTFVTLAPPARASVTSVAARDVTSTTVTLPATISPRGQAGTYVFEYGTAKDLKGATATLPIAIGPAGTALPVAYALAGLQPNTRYYYRAVVTNPTGRTTGMIRTFLTLRDVAGVSVRAARTMVIWGGSTVLTGVVTGGGVGGVQVRLMRQDFPYATAPTEVAAMTTSDAGIYSFAVGPIRAGAKLWVQTRTTPFLSSKMVAIRSKLLVQFRTLRRTSRSSTVRALINPRIPKGKAYLQRRTSGRWVTVKRPKLSHSQAANRSSFTATIARRSTTERYRVVVDPNDAGGHVRNESGSVTVSRR